MKKVKNRWLVVFGAILLQVCIGAVYSWSLFNSPLVTKLGCSSNEVVFTYSLIIFVFAFTTMFSGRLQDKIGPRIVATIGGLLYGIGLILSSYATSILQLYIYYGFIAGIGIGFVYVCPLSTCIKWFPDKKGLITGITVGAFGLGSLVFKSIIEFLLSSFGVSMTFFYLGIIYASLIIIGAQLLSVPLENNNLTNKNPMTPAISNNFTVSEMLRIKSFYFIWIMYFFGSMGGLLVIGLAKDIGIELAKLNAETAAHAVSTTALFNASGRLIWGTLSDKFNRVKVVLVMFVITSICMIAMSFISLNITTFFIFLAGITFCFGGFLSVFPTITGEFYGTEHLGANYGIVYQAYGLSALLGPIIVNLVGGLKPTFMISAALSIIGAGMTFLVKPPSKVVNL